MLYNCFEYYKDNAGVYNNIFKKMPVLYYSFILSSIGLMGASIIATIMFLLNKFILGILVIVVMIIVFVFLFIEFNNKAKRIVKKKFKIGPDKWLWNSHNVVRKMFERDKGLIKKHIKNKKIPLHILNLMLGQTKEEINQLKPKFPIIPSLFAALSISVINNFVGWIFKQSSIVSNVKNAILVMVSALFILLVFFVVYKLCETMVVMIIESFFSKDYYKMIRFKEILEEITWELASSNEK